MAFLDRLELSSASACSLVSSAGLDSVSYDVRLTILHELNTAITRLREQQGMPPFDDRVPGERDNVFRRIKHILLFAAPPGAHPGSNHMKQAK